MQNFHKKCHNKSPKCLSVISECIMLSVIMLSVIMLNVIMLSVVAPYLDGEQPL